MFKLDKNWLRDALFAACCGLAVVVAFLILAVAIVGARQGDMTYLWILLSLVLYVAGIAGFAYLSTRTPKL